MPLDFIFFLRWYIALTAFGFLALPLAFRFFKHLPERGYAFARPLGVLVICYVFWLLGSLGFLRNDVGGQIAAAVAVGGLGLAWLKREGLVELRDWLRERGAYALAVEIFFLAAFGGMALARAYTPEIVATEKPMEFMFINSILRSPGFPPHDAWLSGHAISYYYFGYVMVASLARLTGVPSAYAFNLGLAMLFAFTAVGALGVVLNLIALAKAAGRSARAKAEKFIPRPSSFLLSAFWPALLGPLMVLVAGNFYGVLAMAHTNGMFPDLKIPAVWYDFGGEAAGAGGVRCSMSTSEGVPGVRAGMVNLWTWLDIKGMNAPPPPPPEKFNWDPRFWWWFSGARVVHDCNLSGVETEAIDEMPAFSFILGDMHPHVLALPFVVLAVAVALEWLLVAGNGRRVSGDAGALIPDHLLLIAPDRLLLSAIILGGLSFLNTWDFPMYWFLTVAAFAVGSGLQWGWNGLVNRWRYLGSVALILGVLSVGLYLPFFLVFQSQASGLLPNLIYPTRFQQTFVMFGPTLIGVALLVGWLVFRHRAVINRPAAWWAGGGIVVLLILTAAALALGGALNAELLDFVDQALAPLTRDQAVGLLVQRRLVDSLATLFPAALVGLIAGLVVGVLRCATSSLAGEPPSPGGTLAPEAKRSGAQAGEGDAGESLPQLRSPALLMSLVMTLTGALLLLGPEYVYLRDNFGTRMNTLFKFYFQVWVLWGLASAFGLWYLFQYAGRLLQWIAGAVMGLAILGGLVYTLAGLYSKTDHFGNPPTLNGMAYFERDYPSDWAAIQWLQQNAPGAPVIAEGIGGQYWIEGRFSRMAMATGLPTVMGWPGHEGQWRGQYFEKVAEREGKIRDLYQTRDWAAAQAILDAYDIEYVVVSSLEQSKYQDLQTGKRLEQAKFDRHMRVVFQNGDVTVYRRLDSRPE